MPVINRNRNNDNRPLGRLNVIYWNSRTLRDKRHQLSIELDQSHNRPLHQCIHIYCFCECRLTPSIFELYFNPVHSDYTSIYHPSTENTNGGLLFLIHKSLSYSLCPEYNATDLYHSSDIRWIRVKFRTTESLFFLVGSVYLNPLSSQTEHIQPIIDSIDLVRNTNIPFIVGGDYNAYHPLWNCEVPNRDILSYEPFHTRQNKSGLMIQHYLSSHQLAVLNTLFKPLGYDFPVPTHGNTVIDLIFTSDPLYCNDFQVLLSDKKEPHDIHQFLLVSDHTPLYCSLISNQIQQGNKFNFSRKVWKCNTATEEHWNDYSIDLDQHQYTLLFSNEILMLEQLFPNRVIHSDAQDMFDACWLHIKSSMTQTAHSTIGMKTIKPQHKFWFSIPSIVSLLKQRNYSHSKFIKVRKKFRNSEKEIKEIESFISTHPGFHAALGPNGQYIIDTHTITLQGRVQRFGIIYTRIKQELSNITKSFYDAIKEVQRSRWKKLIEGIHDPAQCNQVQWKIFHRTMGTSFTDITSVKNPQGKSPDNTKEALDNAAQYFSSISSTSSLAPNVDENKHDNSFFQSGQDFFELLSSNPNHRMFRTPHENADEEENVFNNNFATREVFISYCRHLPCNTALGWDNISPYFLKHSSDNYLSTLHRFFVQLYRFGIIPLDWTKSNIFALHKKGDKTLASNFRPISLTPICLRLYERLLLPNIWGILQKRGIPHPLQAGFRKNHGTLDGLYWFTKSIKDKFNRKPERHIKPYLPVAFLDLTKAFDRINIPLTLFKLYLIGIRGHLLLFFAAFLRNRYIRVMMFDLVSDWHSIDMGTPQGSVLGPILFLVYINDLIVTLHNLNNSIRPSAYADDVVLVPDALRPNFSLMDMCVSLQQSLDICSLWAESNRMTFSKDKSNILLFSNDKYCYSDPDVMCFITNIRLRAFNLPEFPMSVVTNYRYLGINFNYYSKDLLCLHWNEMIQSAEFRAHKILRVLHSDNVPPPVGIVLVQSILRSKISYGLPLLHSKRKDIYSKLDAITAKPLRVVLGLPKSTSTMAVLDECGISHVSIWKQKLSLQLANRFSEHSITMPNHESGINFYQYDYTIPARSLPPSRSYKTILSSFGSCIHQIENKYPEFPSKWTVSSVNQGHADEDDIDPPAHYPVPVPDPIPNLASEPIDHRILNHRNLKAQELNQSRQLWLESGCCRALAELKPRVISTIKKEFYLYHDPPNICRMRSRLRFNAAKTNVTLHKYRLIESPHCDHPQCNRAGIDETRQHVLLECPKYNRNRQTMMIDLVRECNIALAQINVNVILGDFKNHVLSLSVQQKALTITGVFLKHLRDTRFRDEYSKHQHNNIVNNNNNPGRVNINNNNRNPQFDPAPSPNLVPNPPLHLLYPP